MDRWSDLGRVVLSARMSGGYSDTLQWAKAVGRSTRMLLGLERGEPVGPKTLAKVEMALGWPVGWSHRVLAGEVEGPPLPPRVADLSARQPHLSSVEAEADAGYVEVVPQPNPVIAAIEADPYLLPEAKEHFLNQYALLRRVTTDATHEGLAYVARGQATDPLDPEREAELAKHAVEVAAENHKARRPRPKQLK